MVTEDPSAVWRPVPRVGWRPPESRPIAYPHPHLLGALVGLATGITLVVVGVLISAVGGLGPFDRSTLENRALESMQPLIGIGIWSGLVGSTGALGGALLGRSAFRAQSRLEWAWVVLALALLAVVIGAFEVGIGAALGNLPTQIDSPGLLLGLATDVAGGALLALIGIGIFGLVVLPFTLVAAGLWAVVMWWIRRRLAREPREVGP